MTIETFSQRDPKWSNELLGFNTSTYTVGGYGCLITSICMACNYYGKKETPSTINKKLKEVKGFSNGGLYNWGSIEKVFPDIDEQWIGSFPDPLTNAQMDIIKNALKNGYPVMVEIDFQPQTAEPDMHFVLLTDYNPNDENDFTMADPWTGAIGSLKLYLKASKPTARKSIQQIIIYKGQIPQLPDVNCEEKVKDLKKALQLMTEDRDKIQRMFDELSIKYVNDGKSNAEHIEALQTSVINQGIQITSMNKTMSDTLEEKTRLLEDSVASRKALVDMTASKNAEIKKLNQNLVGAQAKSDKWENKYNSLKKTRKKWYEFWRK